MTYVEFASTGTGRVRPGARDGLRLPEVGEDDRRSARPPRARRGSSYQEDIGTRDSRAVIPRSARPTRRSSPTQGRHVRDAPQSVRVLPLDHRLAGVRDRTSSISISSRPICSRSRRHRTSRSSRRTSATTVTTHRASTASPGGLVSADRFLAPWVPKILASPAYKADGMLVITFDEAAIGRRTRPRAVTRRRRRTPPSPGSTVRAAAGSARSSCRRT